MYEVHNSVFWCYLYISKLQSKINIPPPPLCLYLYSALFPLAMNELFSVASKASPSTCVEESIPFVFKDFAIVFLLFFFLFLSLPDFHQYEVWLLLLCDITTPKLVDVKYLLY